VLQGAQLQGHWIGGGRPQPALETINSLGFGLAGQMSKGLRCLAALVRGEGRSGLPGCLGEAGLPRLRWRRALGD
jgi:hypothetical protein